MQLFSLRKEPLLIGGHSAPSLRRPTLPDQVLPAGATCAASHCLIACMHGILRHVHACAAHRRRPRGASPHTMRPTLARLPHCCTWVSPAVRTKRPVYFCRCHIGMLVCVVGARIPHGEADAHPRCMRVTRHTCMRSGLRSGRVHTMRELLSDAIACVLLCTNA